MAATPSDSHCPDRLVDRFGRHITYVRLSVTDRCDLRCVYCMAEDMQFLPRSQMLTLEEIARLGRCFSALGVTKLRITGGEPLVRRNVLWLFERLGALPGIRDLTLTTNGTQLARYAAALAAAGVTRVNVSLDSLRPERFRAITRLGESDAPWTGSTRLARRDSSGSRSTASSSGTATTTRWRTWSPSPWSGGLDISFIEEMPLGVIGDHDRAEAYYSSEQIRRDLRRPLRADPHHRDHRRTLALFPDRRHRQPGRLHLAPQPQLLRRLQPGAGHRRGPAAAVPGPGAFHRPAPGPARQPRDDAAVKRAIVAAMSIKPRGHDFDLSARPVIFRHMNATGG